MLEELPKRKHSNVPTLQHSNIPTKVIDAIGIIILVLSFFRGWRKGIVVALCSLLAVIIGMLAALKLSTALGAWMMEHEWVTSAWAQIISYILIFLCVLWLVRLLAKAVEGVLKMAMLGFINRLVGALLYGFIGAFIWSSMLWVANYAHLITPESMAASHTYEYFAPIAPWVFAHIGAVLPFAKDIFADLSRFFDGVNQHLPGHVGAH
jgi:membrane protein required for colicin V production